MQDKTLENSTDIWWIKCLFVVRRFDEMMTNFVLNVCKSEPKFWANIIQHGDTCELLFSFYQSDFLWCCFYVIKQSFNYRIMCIYLHLYVNIIDLLFFFLQIFTIFYILTLKLNGFKLICSFIWHVKCSKWTKIPFNRRAFLLWCSYKIAKKNITPETEISKTYIPLQNSPPYWKCIFSFDDIAIPILTGF